MTRVDESEQGRFFIDTEIGFRLEDGKTFSRIFLSRKKRWNFYQLERKFIWKTFLRHFSLPFGMEKLAQSLMKIYRWKCFNYLDYLCLFIYSTDRLWAAWRIETSQWTFNRVRETVETGLFWLRTFMLSESLPVTGFCTANGISEVKHVVHETVDASESVDFGGNFDCAKPC